MSASSEHLPHLDDTAAARSAAAGAAPLRWAEMPRPIVALAPMDGVTDTAYRQVVRRINPDVVLFSEFTSADGFLRSEKVRRRLDFHPEEQPYFVQLFGNTPEHFAEAARAMADAGVTGIDINMGCPSKKIAHHMHGAGMMRDVANACRVVEAVARACGLDVSVKTRLGWESSAELVPFARALQDAGASLVTIHGRTYNQAFRGEADWTPVHALKEALRVPVLGNGDVRDRAHGMERLGNLDGFMIGRAAIGNPWVFRRPGTPAPTWAEKAAVMGEHFRLMCEHKPERVALLEFRRHVSEYVRGIPAAKAVRKELMASPGAAALLERIGALARFDGVDDEGALARAS